MSRCSCCGGTCKFPCCSGKSPSNVCAEIKNTRILDLVYKTGGVFAYTGYGTSSISDGGLLECQDKLFHGPYIQYKYSTHKMIDISIDGSTLPLNAKKVNIYMENRIIKGDCQNISYYLVFPIKSVIYSDDKYPCDFSKNYYDEFGFGVLLGGLGTIDFTYDFNSISQYRLRTNIGNSLSTLNGHSLFNVDMSFGDFGLCKCCENNKTKYLTQMNIPVADSTTESGAKYGYILAVVEQNPAPIENANTLSLQIVSEVILTYDIDVTDSGVRLLCPAFSNCATKTSPTTTTVKTNINPNNGKSNSNGWGNISTSVKSTDTTVSTASTVDNYIGVISPQLVNESNMFPQYFSQINTNNSNDILESWIAVHNPLENLGASYSKLPFQLKDLDGSVLVFDINNTQTVGNVQFYYPNKTNDIAIYISENNIYNGIFTTYTNPNSYGYIKSIVDNFLSSVTANCTDLKTGNGFINCNINYLNGTTLYQYSLLIRQMASSTDCDTSEYIKNNHCHDCYSVYINNVGYISKYFRLTEISSSNSYTGIANVDLIYNESTGIWESESLCRTLVCNNFMLPNPVLESCQVNVSLSFDIDGAKLTVISSGDNNYSETYIIPNNNDCALSASSLLFDKKQDNSAITNNFLNCFPYTVPTIQKNVPIKYLVMPFFLLYPNGR